MVADAVRAWTHVMRINRWRCAPWRWKVDLDAAWHIHVRLRLDADDLAARLLALWADDEQNGGSRYVKPKR
jgi:hypothetical protein